MIIVINFLIFINYINGFFYLKEKTPGLPSIVI
jgi:hypothetical protein